MRGISTALPLTVNARLRTIIEKESQKVSLSHQLKRRLTFILDGINGKSIGLTVKELRTSRDTVNRWRKRWNASIDELIRVSEQGISGRPLKEHELMGMIKEVLSDKPRIGAPKSITLDQEEQIRTLACTNPEEHGIPMSNWTHEMLAHVAKAKGIIENISSRYVGIILKKTK